MGMQRVFYVGAERCHDARLGLDLYPGYAFDCPSPMAAALLREPCFRDAPGGSLVTDAPGTEITWYAPEPGEELLALSGVGPARAREMVSAGVSFLSDLLALDDTGVERLAGAMRGITVQVVRDWCDQARYYQGG